jgi:hypothetical protein
MPKYRIERELSREAARRFSNLRHPGQLFEVIARCNNKCVAERIAMRAGTDTPAARVRITECLAGSAAQAVTPAEYRDEVGAW